MTITPAQKAIANLIDSAEKGEIDPWDVPVIQVIDSLLDELGLIETPESPNQSADLPQSGQAFLWASMLVLLKADTLELVHQMYGDREEDLEFVEEILLDESENKSDLPPNLENHIRRRTSISSMKKRRVTLQELIEQLEHIAAEIESGNINKPAKKSSTSRRAAIKAIAQLAHNENLTELAFQLENFLSQQFSQSSTEQDFMDWEKLLSWWHENSSDREDNYHSREDRAGVFWALLLLSSQSKVELSQEEFYQDLSIRPLIHI